RPILKSEIDLVILPGAAFDKKGNRIGSGSGYYDIFLKGMDCPKIALCFDFQIVKKIPAEEHDVKADKVITD
ncbi:5-formyltetrahydrofolate cyclo-ligase, partial [Candidatus Woesearchaeota archaeon]|nr:5-formyltetrahydrofolate cyclo-ligase [Candidatus Woesearchaeota archaeon]